MTSKTSASPSPFTGYRPLDGTFDECFAPSGEIRPAMRQVLELLEGLGRRELRSRQRIADSTFLKGGITFSVYSDTQGSERIFPFDLIPRVIQADEWGIVRSGLEQRVRALNAFLGDVYGEQRILREKVIPEDLVLGASGYTPQVRGIVPPGGVYVHIAGIDLIRDPEGRFVVLEDNARTPSGVSYVLENRAVMKKVLPRVFAETKVAGVEEYPIRLRDALADVGPAPDAEDGTVVLTPGPLNSAYFEHSFLARRMGVPLVEGRDLFARRVYAKTTLGPRRIDVIYRRIDDPFLDPEAFRPDSMLGVPGLFRAYAAGNVALANAIGNGVADDKGIYPFVPDMVRFYLSEEPVLGQVDTYVCAREDDLAYVLEHVGQLVIKAVNEAGGYGMLIGPQSTREEQAEFREKIRANPRNYIAQPRIELSTCPTFAKDVVGPRRVDLRPYIVTGRDTWVLPGGAHPRGARRGVLRGQLESGRWLQGHLGSRGKAVISRVAESCFWMNRYVERVEVLSRMLGVNLAFQLDVAMPDAERWRPLVVVAGEEEDFLKRTAASDVDDAEVVQEYLTWSDDNASSLRSSLRFARENARTIRETISLEMWETLNDLWVWFGEPAARRLYRSDRYAFYLKLRNQCLLFHGTAQATMLHEDPFEFMRLGTALERAGQTARILDIKHHGVGPTTAGIETPEEAAQWLATLRYCSGAEPFLKRGEQAVSGAEVAAFLLFEPHFSPLRPPQSRSSPQFPGARAPRTHITDRGDDGPAALGGAPQPDGIGHRRRARARPARGADRGGREHGRCRPGHSHGLLRPRDFGRQPTAAARRRLGASGLCDADSDGKRLGAATSEDRSGGGCRISVVATAGDPDVVGSDLPAVGRVEAVPAHPRHVQFDPGVESVALLFVLVGSAREHVAHAIARRPRSRVAPGTSSGSRSPGRRLRATGRRRRACSRRSSSR